MKNFSSWLRDITRLGKMYEDTRTIRIIKQHEETRKMFEPLKELAVVERYIDELCMLLTTSKVSYADSIRLGKNGDGGYVMIDDFSEISICYSFGVAGDISWETSIAKRGIDVFMYDHTINGIEGHNERLHWEKIGICGEANKGDDRLLTLEKLLEKNNHIKCENMILKMDIEGAEWDVLATIDETILSKFDQIVFELHNIFDIRKSSVILQGLRKLNETHQIVHIHGNNAGSFISWNGRNIPEFLECTYVRKNNRDFIKEKSFFPTIYDQRNYDNLPEIILGEY